MMLFLLAWEMFYIKRKKKNCRKRKCKSNYWKQNYLVSQKHCLAMVKLKRDIARNVADITIKVKKFILNNS